MFGSMDASMDAGGGVLVVLIDVSMKFMSP